MGKIKKHLPVKLVIGLIFKDNKISSQARALLERKFGRIDFESESLDFRHTDYYEQEFGKDLKRRFFSFARLIPPESLAAIKIITNHFEAKFSRNKSRSINIDPGYLELSKFILATAKDYTHRIYLGKGIYAEITLFYRGNSFCPWEWTYPDYRTDAYIRIFNRIRQIYAEQVKGK